MLAAVGLAGIATGTMVDKEIEETPPPITAAAMADGVVVVRYDLNQSDEVLIAKYGALPRRIPDGRTALIVGHCQDQPERVCYGQIPQTR